MLKVVLLLAAIAMLVVAFAVRGRRTSRRAASRKQPRVPVIEPVPAPTKSLGRAEVLCKLHELAFGAPLELAPQAVHAKAATAIGAALDTAASDPKYAPRRPLLLPQLLQAVGAGDTSRRELADIIARDPSLVGSLLRLANSPFYRASEEPIESIERAITVMGTQGVRSLIATALVQPVFRSAGAAAGRFPEIVWEHSYCAGAAAEVHAAAVENDDPFAAQLLAMVTGLATIVVYRVAMDLFAARGLQPDATALAAVLDEHTPATARRIAAGWELSERILEALEDQLPGKPVQPATALGRSLRFGIVAGALLVLYGNAEIDDEAGRASLVAAGGSGPKFKALWARFAQARTAERAA